MKALKFLPFNFISLNRVFSENFVKSRHVIWMGQSNRNMMGETYEGSGKTTGYILNKKGIDVLCVDYVTVNGFVLTNGWNIVGPTIFFPHTIIGWKIKDFSDVNEDSLALFSILRPKLDCLIIGCGHARELRYARVSELLRICKKMDLNVELLRTETAAATFNFCALDRKFVAAALIPPKDIQIHGLKLITSADK